MLKKLHVMTMNMTRTLLAPGQLSSQERGWWRRMAVSLPAALLVVAWSTVTLKSANIPQAQQQYHTAKGKIQALRICPSHSVERR
jgi:ferric-dicitrate binding protein FerR (iron transport regulator)